MGVNGAPARRHLIYGSILHRGSWRTKQIRSLGIQAAFAISISGVRTDSIELRILWKTDAL